MRRIISFLAVMLLSSSLAWGGNNVPLRIELGAGVTYTPEKLFFGWTTPGESAYAEIRYNLPGSPFDFGIRAQGDMFGRRSERRIPNLNFGSCRFMAVGDYNWRMGEHSFFFVGCGLGVANCAHTKDVRQLDPASNAYVDEGQALVFAVQPRIGVELWKHLRLSLDYSYGDSANSFAGLHVGFVF